MRIASAVLILLALALGAQAAPVVTYDVQGYAPDVEGPGGIDTYEFTFTLDLTPTITSNPDPDSFLVSPSVEFFLNGTDEGPLTGTVSVTFFDAAEGGLLSINSDTVQFFLNGPPLFLGSNTDPSLQTPGTFLADKADDTTNLPPNQIYGQFGDTVLSGGEVTASGATSLPEPGTLPLMMGAALLLAPPLLKFRKNR
ncbi:MAG: hypothetical protein ABSH46_11620 [Bryobacteraceae bacterium]|jgi:hypothetical protein